MFPPALDLLRQRIFRNVLGTEAASELIDQLDEPAYNLESLDPTDQLAFSELQDLEDQLNTYSSAPLNTTSLKFNIDSNLFIDTNNKWDIFLALPASDPETRILRYRLDGLQGLLAEIGLVSSTHPALDSHKQHLILSTKTRIDDMLMAAWSERERRLTEQASVSARGVRIVREAESSVHLYTSPLAIAILVLTAITHVVMGVARAHCNFLLRALRAILSMVSSMQDSRSQKFIQHHINDIPTTLHTTLQRLNLPPALVLYASCPKCSALYHEGKENAIPERCSKANLDGLVCGHELSSTRRRGTRTWQKPIRRYSHMLFESWLSDMLQRPGVEDLLEAARPRQQAVMTDLWDAPYMCAFPGPDDPNFFEPPSGELHLGMLLFHDFFNPLHNMESGKKRSIGCFFMVCLNLPPGIRYNASNAYFVSMVPGPAEPSHHDLQEFIEPIVNDMAEVYSPGIWISKTHKYPQGRKVRAAVAVKSMDIPAARAVGGFASHSHTCFCNFCTATRSVIDIPSLESCQLRDIQSHRQLVQLWSNAPSTDARNKLWDLHGVSSTHWLRFPWWDPFACIVIGPMHWTKNVLEKQLRKNMEWSWSLPAGVPSNSSASAPPISELEYDWGQRALAGLSKDEFTNSKLTATLVHYLCVERGIFEAGLSSLRLLDDLNKWRIENGIITTDGALTAQAIAKLDGIPVSVARARYYASKAKKPSALEAHATLPDLLYLCKSFQLATDGRKEDLAKRLIEYYSRIRVPEVPAIGLESSKVKSQPKVSVLGLEVLSEIRDDMERTTIPSWLKQPPLGFATFSHGKIQAEEYKSLAVISMTITLVRLWGRYPAGPLRDRLDHFLHLMLAVRIVSFQSLVESDIVAFEHHYGQYMKGLRTLYPHATVTPVQHMGLHMPRFLRSMGPTVRYSESTCELFNGMLQNISTNFKFGDLELTLHREFVMASRLKGMIDQKSFIKPLGEFGLSVQEFLEEYIPNHKTESWQTTHSASPKQLDNNVYASLNSWVLQQSVHSLSSTVFTCRNIRIGSVIYTPFSESAGNSCVLFEVPASSDIVPGRIDFILQEGGVPAPRIPRILLVVRAFRRLSTQDSFRDPYLNHPIIGKEGANLARLYYDDVEDESYILEPRDLISHVAVCSFSDPEITMTRKTVVILSLDLKHKRYN